MSALLALESESGWQSRALGDLLAVQNGFAFSSKKFSETKGVPLIRIRDLKNDGASAVKFDGEYDPSYLIDDGDLLIGMDGEFVCYEWAGGPALLNQRVCRLTDFSSDLEPRFVLYGINKFLREIEDATTFTTVKHLSSKKIKTIEFPLPPLEKQKRIVAMLDQAFAALDRARVNAEANLVDAEAVRDQFLDARIASLAESFGLISIGDIASVRGGKRLPKGQKTSPIETAYPYISVRDMNDQGTIDTDRVQYISQQNYEAISRYVISKDDIYVSIAGTIAKTGVIPAELDGANLTENAAKLVLTDGWLRDYVYWCTRSSCFKEQAIEQTRTAAQPKLALQRLAAIRIPAADSDGQAALCEAVAALRQSIIQIDEAFRSKLGDIADLRQSLLQKAFAGELS